MGVHNLRKNRWLSGVLLIGGAGLLCACGQGENDPGPGGVTVGEARALDEAAEMLEARRLPSQLLTPTPADGPAQQGTGAPQ